MGDQHEQDRLLQAVLDDRRLSEAQKARVISRVGELRDAHPDLPRVATCYLRCVVARGPGMFSAPVQRPLNGSAPTLTCGCGRQAAAADRETVGGRTCLTGTCACGAKLTWLAPRNPEHEV